MSNISHIAKYKMKSTNQSITTQCIIESNILSRKTKQST